MGTINTTDTETGEITEFFFIIEEIRFKLIPIQEYDFKIDRSKLEYKEKALNIIFVLPKSIIQEKVDRIFWNLVNYVQVRIIVPFLCITIVMMLVGSYFLNMIAENITDPIINLKEEIGDIIEFRMEEKQGFKQQAGREWDIMNTYQNRNDEVNKLHLAFSRLTKSVRLAKNSLDLGDDNKALLNYHEVADLFYELKNQEKFGICLNNIGCLYLKKSQFENASIFLVEAINSQKDLYISQNKKLRAKLTALDNL